MHTLASTIIDMALVLANAGGLICFLLVFWWLYRAVHRLAEDLRHIRNDAMPQILERLGSISNHTDQKKAQAPGLDPEST